jgi:hypothetical protein
LRGTGGEKLFVDYASTPSLRSSIGVNIVGVIGVNVVGVMGACTHVEFGRPLRAMASALRSGRTNARGLSRTKDALFG